MKAPGFWWREPGSAARLLQPASLVYGAAAAARMRRPGARARLPVICVGNLTLGGTGKTPAAIAIAGMLAATGRRPAFLTRGYGGRIVGPLLVEPGRHTAADVGDEALLLARHAPTIVSRVRPPGAELCAEAGADIVVMDDGLQNPSLAKDLTLAVFDGSRGVGNGLTFPAGPLRAPVHAQLPFVDAFLVVGPDRAGTARLAGGRPVLSGEIVPDRQAAERLRGQRVSAFAGIGYPAKFFGTLRACGAELVRTEEFADHHRYTAAEVTSLCDAAASEGLTLITTEKDRVRLEGLGGREDRIGSIATLPVSLRFGEPDRLAALLEAAIEGCVRRASAEAAVQAG